MINKAQNIKVVPTEAMTTIGPIKPHTKPVSIDSQQLLSTNEQIVFMKYMKGRCTQLNNILMFH
jgi:hypothetical protein